MMALIQPGSFLLGGALIGFMASWLVIKIRGDSAAAAGMRIKEDAKKEAEHTLREAKVSAKAEILKMREEFDEEAKELRRELSQVEKRLNLREENLEKKADATESRMRSIENREVELAEVRQRLAERETEIKQVVDRQIQELERVSSMSRDEARELIVGKVEGEIRNELGIMARNLVEETKQKTEREAQKLLTYAIQRYAGDCTYERTTATIPLPTDELKGRIIGREGRNIRALEATTGVSILIDDTPEAVVISCFDPIRKEAARLLLCRLIEDGRIHPTRIEELFKKITKDLDEEIKEAGEAAVLEAGIQNVPAPIIKLLGRLKYRYSFSQNVLKHSLETAYFMGSIAAEMGLDEKMAKRIGLLHDIGKAVDHEIEGSHAVIGANILRKHNESKIVINAVAAHHEDEEGNSLYATLVNACDALSASRPGARSETTELYLKRLEDLERIARAFKGVDGCFALQAGRDLRVVIKPEDIPEGEAQMLARDICNQIEREMTYPGQIKVTVVRETRSVEYAK